MKINDRNIGGTEISQNERKFNFQAKIMIIQKFYKDSNKFISCIFIMIFCLLWNIPYFCRPIHIKWTEENDL